MNKFTEISNV